MTSQAGLDEINRHVRGGVRARLSYANLCRVEVPVPAEPSQWDEFLQAMVELRGTTSKGAGPASAHDLAVALFADA